jgi:PAS domain S-box-containing protein
MKIGTKFALTFLIFAFFLALIAFVQQQYSEQLSQTFKKLETNTIPELTALLESLSATRRASLKAVEFSMRGQPRDRDKTLEALDQLRNNLNKYNQINHQKAPEFVRKINILQHNFKESILEYLGNAEHLAATRISDEEQKIQATRTALVKALYPLVSQQYQKLNNTTHYTSSRLRQASRIQLISTLVISLLAIIGAFILAKLITNPLNKLNQAADQIGHGRLDVEIDIDSADEIGQLAKSFRRMALSLKQQNQMLVESEERFSKAFYGLPIPMGILDLDKNIRIDCNNSYCEHLGFKRDEILGNTYLRNDFWQDPVQQKQTVQDIIHQQHVYNQVTEIRIKSGAIKTFLFSAARLDIKDKNLAIVSLLDITEQKQLESRLKQEISKLKATEQKLEHAQRIAHLGNWEFDIANNIVYWSDEIYRIFGLDKTRDIASFKNFLNVIHPDDRERLQQTFEQSLTSKTPYEIEHRLLLADGTVKYLYGKGETLYDESGAALRTIGTVQDITQQKQHEAIAQRLNRMFEHSAEEIYIFDGSNLKFLQVSRGALDNLGYSQQEIETLTPIDIKPDLTAQEFKQLLIPLTSGERSQFIFETRHRRKDGSLYPVEVRLQYAAEDITPAFLAIVIDLTERKKVQAELEKHRNQLEQLVQQRTAKIRQQASIIDQTHDSVITVDLDGNITSWNGGAERLFHMKAEQTLGKSVSIVYPEGSEDFLQNKIIKPVIEKGSHEIEVRLQRADGHIFPAHLSLSMLHDEQAKPTGIVGYSLDLSETKKREQQLDQLSRKLQESNKELEAFSYSVSHDLRAPLRSIDGFSLAIVEDYGDRLDDTGKDYLSRVRKAAQRMGTLIDELLELSRVNRAEMKLETLNLNEIAQASFDELAANDPKRQVELELEDNMQMIGDARLCGIVIDNLIGNAWKFTVQQEKARITIKSLADNPKVFYISDNGVGFDMRHADKLFGAFQRLHQATEFPGTGVGLATVQRIINRHGGKIWAESQPGEGATFFFTFDPEQTPPALNT